MSSGRTLTVFVMGETPRSLKSVEIGNRTLKAFLGGRQHVTALKQRQELSEPAVYLLLDDSNDDGLTSIYIGETDDCAQRILTHANNSEKDWWAQFIVFIGKNLTKAHVKHLERELFLLAKKSTSIKIMNSPKSEPGGTSLPEHAISDMKEFVSDILFVLATLGLGYFDIKPIEPISVINTGLVSSLEGQIFYLPAPKELENEKIVATMEIKSGIYVLKKGSLIKSVATEAFSSRNAGYFSLWQKIVNSDAVEKSIHQDFFITTRDLEFQSPSAAGAIARSRATNGRVEWKRSNDNKPLFECEIEV